VFWPAAVLAAIRFGQAWLRDWEPVLLHTGVMFGLVAVAWFTVAQPRLRGIMTSRVAAGIVAIALVGGVGQAIVTRPADPTPGLASTTTVEVGSRQANVVVVPNLPGWNLVHVDNPDVEVGTTPSNLTRPTNGWLPLRLPPGRTELWVSDGRDRGSFVTDTGAGTAPPGLTGLTGPDGPECATALLGRMLATGTLPAGVECPAQSLTPTDSEQLTEAVERLAENGATNVAVLTDESPRGRAAAETVAATAAAIGISVVEPTSSTAPVVVVSGTAPDLTGSEVILAPWLAVGNPESFRQYKTAQRAAYPTIPPSMAGFQAWLSVRENQTAP
jgi:hypothetical protein